MLTSKDLEESVKFLPNGTSPKDLGVSSQFGNPSLAGDASSSKSSSSSSDGSPATILATNATPSPGSGVITQQQQHSHSILAAAWACIWFSVISITMVLTNKLLLTTFKFNYPMVLLFHQSLSTVISLLVARHLNLVTFENLERQRVIKWLPVDFFFVLMLLTSFYSVRLLSIPMVTIFKNTNNIFIAAGDALVFDNYPSSGVVGTLVLMSLAAMLAGMYDLEYNFEGYIWTLANCLTTTLFTLYTQYAIRSTKLSTFGKVYYNNLLSLPMVLVMDAFVFQDFRRLFTQTGEKELEYFTNLTFMGLFLTSGVLGFLQSYASLNAQKLTSATTYSNVGSLKNIPQTVLGVLIFKTPMSREGVLFISLGIVATLLFSYTKAREAQATNAQIAQYQQLAASSGGPNGTGSNPSLASHPALQALQHRSIITKSDSTVNMVTT